MSRPRGDDDTDFDDPDVNIGDWVYARAMQEIGDYEGDEATPVSLYFPETTLKTGPVWTEGFWDTEKKKWWTAFGHLGSPTAWAPLPKTPGDWV